jgi:hypothetical protein
MKKRNKREVHRCSCERCRLHPYSQEAKWHQSVNRVLSELNERNRRRFAGVLANEEGRGGISHLAEITGLSRTTIARGCREIERSNRKLPLTIRQSGAGRPLVEKNSQKS